VIRIVSAALSAAALATLVTGCASNPPPRDLGRLAFMVGCWTSPPPAPAGETVNLEVWSPSENGIMFGYATSTRDGTLVTWEQSRISLVTQPATYTASPEGQRPVIFVEAPQRPRPYPSSMARGRLITPGCAANPDSKPRHDLS